MRNELTNQCTCWTGESAQYRSIASHEGPLLICWHEAPRLTPGNSLTWTRRKPYEEMFVSASLLDRKVGLL